MLHRAATRQSKNVWSPLKPPLGVARLSATAILSAMKDTAVRRLAVISAAGVGESGRTMNGVMRWMVRHSTVGEMYTDLATMEQVLRQSSVDWVAVRPVTLVNAAPSRRTKVLAHFRTVSIVGRADVAAWLVRSVVDPALITDRTPMIGWW
ncbi:MAG: NAD(P)H-binding protein [Gemmatimonadaceae bacterium]